MLLIDSNTSYSPELINEYQYFSSYSRNEIDKYEDYIILKDSNKMIDNGNNMYREYSLPNGVKVVHGTVKNYFLDLAKNNRYVNIDKKIIGGVPAIQGHRISVSLIIACLKDGMTIDEIMEDYNLSKETVIGVIEYVISILDEPYEE